MLGGVTPASVIPEILGEAGWTLCHNYGAASQRNARGRFVLQWQIWWILVVFAFYLADQVDGELAIAGVDNAHCTEILVYMNLLASRSGQPEALFSSPCGLLCMGGIDDVDSRCLNAAVRQRR